MSPEAGILASRLGFVNIGFLSYKLRKLLWKEEQWKATVKYVQNLRDNAHCAVLKDVAEFAIGKKNVTQLSNIRATGSAALAQKRWKEELWQAACGWKS